MGVVVPVVRQLLTLCFIGFVLSIQGSTGNTISPSPSNFVEIPPLEGIPSPFDDTSPSRGSSPRSESHVNGSSNIQHPVALQPASSPLVPPIIKGHAPAFVPRPSIVTSPNNTAPSPLTSQHVTSLTPRVSILPPPGNVAPPPQLGQGLVPTLAPEVNLPRNSSANSHTRAPGMSPSNPGQRNATFSGAPPMSEPIAPVASPPRRTVMPMIPTASPSTQPVPMESPTGKLPVNAPQNHPVVPREPTSAFSGQNTSQAPNSSPKIHSRNKGAPVAAPPEETPELSPPVIPSPTKAPSKQNATRHYDDTRFPPQSSPNSPPNNGHHAPSSSPSISLNHAPKKGKTHAAAPSYQIPPPTSEQRGPVVSPSVLPWNRQTHFAPLPIDPASSSGAPTSHDPFIEPKPDIPPTPSPSATVTSGGAKTSSSRPPMPFPPPIRTFPPPPPNTDCTSTVCMDPYTNTPPGSPCSCVLPVQVGLSLSVELYTFFPLVSELAQEIASGVFLKQSQVRIMGANAANQEPLKTVVLIDLVPLGVRFDNTTAYFIFERFWHKQVAIKATYFGDYEVLYVRYPGLPPSPPLPPSSISIIEGGPYSNDNNGRTIKPLGVDVPRHHNKKGLGGGTIAIVLLSATMVLVLCSAVAWILLLRQRGRVRKPTPSPHPLPPSVGKPAGTTGSVVESGLSSASLSFGSSIATYTGSAKTFSMNDLERATNNFDSSRILGEGGFGRVYCGILEDGTKVAVKVLKRDDQQGGREFFAEIEMLSRLHHRNLVKLIGICTEDRARSLVYELIPNGSVESHLHGDDKESAPLDWDARIKIALGAARGLAYLHEDSSPRVIHRDFKASNILLERDFTPKVSDFGLARTAMDEENRHISTRVMGTFGYVAPEYAMTGHLLVKSDVYSYGVVLLELLTGRKPVDMSQPPGQENLVAWARPLLTTREGLEMIMDPSLGSSVPFDVIAKVAAIASMCVQPEVSHRPFMGEVVQALKLVCNECDESKEIGSRTPSQASSMDMDREASVCSDPLRNETLVANYDSEPDIERGLPMSDFFSASQSARYDGRPESGSLRRCSRSGPLRAGRGRRLWQRTRQLMGGSMSEHRILFRSQSGSH